MKAPIHLALIRRALARADELPPSERADLYEAAADVIAGQPSLFGGEATKPLLKHATQAANTLRRAQAAEILLTQSLNA